MSRASRSLFVFGIYLELLGPVLIVAPNALLDLFGVARTHEVWIRLLGVVVGGVGVYYLLAARAGFRPVIVASVPVRLALMAFVATFVALGYAAPAVLVFGGADVAGAVWTASALRAERRALEPTRVR